MVCGTLTIQFSPLFQKKTTFWCPHCSDTKQAIPIKRRIVSSICTLISLQQSFFFFVGLCCLCWTNLLLFAWGHSSGARWQKNSKHSTWRQRTNEKKPQEKAEGKCFRPLAEWGRESGTVTQVVVASGKWMAVLKWDSESRFNYLLLPITTQSWRYPQAHRGSQLCWLLKKSKHTILPKMNG